MSQAHQDLGVKLIQAEALVKRIEAIVDPRLDALALKYSDDQPRDDQGRWTDGGGSGDSGASDSGSHLLYHGTSRAALANIEQEGLKPGKPHYGREPAVYFTSDPEVAHDIARNYVGRLGQYAIIEISIPDAVMPQVKTDSYMRDSFYLQSNIPKEWIVNTTVYDRGSGKWEPVSKSKSPKNRYFVVVPIINASTKMLTELSAAYKAGGYAGIRSDYRKIIGATIDDYLTSSDRATGYISTMRKAAVEHFTDAFHGGYADGGGDVNEIDPDADTWLTDRIEQEMGFIGELFTALKSLRDEFKAGEIKIADLRDAAATRTDGYTASLDGVYNSGKMWGMKNKMLTWQYGDTEHCSTCLSLNDQRHKANWYLSRDYIPRKPGAAMDCGGYRCQCTLLDDNGNEVTL